MKSETLLLHEVQPRLRGAIPNAVPMVGSENAEELVQDGVVIAMQLHRRARKVGKKVTGGNLAHYALLHLRSGRRSTGYKKNDVHHPAAQLSGRVHLQSLDAPIYEDEHGQEALTLHDCLAAPVDDPATAAARRLDWRPVIEPLDRSTKAVLIALIEGRELTLLVRRLRRSRSALQDDKRRLGRLVREHLGEDILKQVQCEPLWVDTLSALKERLVCRAERRAA